MAAILPSATFRHPINEQFRWGPSIVLLVLLGSFISFRVTAMAGKCLCSRLEYGDRNSSSSSNSNNSRRRRGANSIITMTRR